ncbi:hypothetical protein B0O99DRAFT_713211 [Bisporella sp. PMI_857]|nr:hypothetical protein B0O99DRAFT_713211 [Bisporella sp. PMI_857]
MAEGLDQVVSWYICTVAAVLFVLMRLVVRWRKFGTWAVDDYLIILSTCCLIGDLAIQQHMWNLGMANIGGASRGEFIQIMKMIVPGSTLYVTSLWSIKIALVIFYKKLAAPGSKLQIVYNVALGGLVATFLVIFFDILFQCFPYDKRWSQDPSYQCSKKASDINYWLTILLMSLPISMVLKLQMKTRQKLGVAAIFALGFFVVIASIIRAYYSRRNETMLTCTVSMIETAIAIIATCLPALRTLFLGNLSRMGTYSNGQHYELSSAGRNRAHQSGITSSRVVGGQRKANDSEDELVKEERSVSAPSLGDSGDQIAKGGIMVNTTYQVYKEDEGPARGMDRL